jgi:hypothetical protein
VKVAQTLSDHGEGQRHRDIGFVAFVDGDAGSIRNVARERVWGRFESGLHGVDERKLWQSKMPSCDESLAMLSRMGDTRWYIRA